MICIRANQKHWLKPISISFPVILHRFINFIFWSAGCSFLKAEVVSCSLDVLYGVLGISKFQFLIKNLKEKKMKQSFFPNFCLSKPWIHIRNRILNRIRIHLKCWIRDPQHCLKAIGGDLSAGDGCADGPGWGQAAGPRRPQPVLILRWQQPLQRAVGPSPGRPLLVVAAPVQGAVARPGVAGRRRRRTCLSYLAPFEAEARQGKGALGKATGIMSDCQYSGVHYNFWY